MIKIVTDGQLITKYQKQFVQQLKSFCTKKISCDIGFQGDSFKRTVYYSTKLNFWFTAYENVNRYWNAFGIGEPTQGKNVSITVEINFPYEGINRNIGAALGHNNKGEILVLHRGKIGGGRLGIGKQLFFDNFRGDFSCANDDGIETEFCLISSINSKLFSEQISNFVHEVFRIKNLTANKAIDFAFLNDYKFIDEHFGLRHARRRNKSTIERTHGIVVNALARFFEEKNLKVGNDRNRDLFIYKRGQIKKLFEIKTTSSTQDLYKAVGQLLIYSIPIKTPVDLILVVPDKLNKTVENRLDELGLKILYYSWRNDEPKFNNLGQIF